VRILPLLLALGCAAQLSAATHPASSAADLDRLADRLRPGDVVELSSGTWTDQVLTFRGTGTAERPITLRATQPGGTVLTGASRLLIDGEWLVVEGLHLRAGGPGGDGIAIRGRHNRLTATAVEGGTWKFQTHLFGHDHRVDHCYFAGKTNDDPTFQIEVSPDEPNRHRIERNHFGPRPPLGRNGGETMRIGYSHQSMFTSRTVVEENLFDRCDGELEIISSKSCENIFRANTFLDCAGMLTLRHGNRCLVDGNFFLGHHKKGSGGIRVIGEDHVVTNNYIEAVEQGAFRITSGVPFSQLVQYFQARRCVIAFNTVVDSHGPALELDAGIGGAGRTMRPAEITIANNVFVVPADGQLIKGTEGESWRWAGNVAAGPANAREGIRHIEPKLIRAPDGLLRPAEGSPLLGSAAGEFPKITNDIDGQPRGKLTAVGCDAPSTSPVTRRPLTATDTGPAWLRR
jgi:poly(beta-D-mannuronate) lyase